MSEQLEQGGCPSWGECLSAYVEEARRRAACVAYTLAPEVEETLQRLHAIAADVDAGRVPKDDARLEIHRSLGAASVVYPGKPVPVPIAGAMPGWVTERGVAVGADPYGQPERQAAFFGPRLRGMGVLPVQLLIRNDGDRGVLVRPYEIALRLPDGRALAPVGSAQAAARGQGAPVQFSPVGCSAAYSAPVAGAYGGPRAYGAVSAVAAVVLEAEASTQQELHRQLFFDYRAISKKASSVTTPAARMISRRSRR